MASDDVFTSTLQSKSTSLGKETKRNSLKCLGYVHVETD